MKTLQDWLDFCERLHPVAIDMGLDRVQQVADRLDLHFACPVITVAGTNGKGSTCAMLEAILLEAGYRTGVYTSPHLVHFEERCRLSGHSATSEALAEAFAAVDAARGEVSLTYFEFSTLAILWLMNRAGLDAVILEVGLGGRLDAVNIIDADCAVITSIDLDHMALLGNDRETIGREKAGIMRAGRPVVVSDPMPPQSVVDHAEVVGADLWRFGRDFNFSGDKQQWSWAGRGAQRAGHGRVAWTFSDRARPTGAGARCGPQPALGRCFGRKPGRHGFLPDHPRGLGRDGRQGPAAHAATHGASGGPVVFHRSARVSRGHS